MRQDHNDAPARMPTKLVSAFILLILSLQALVSVFLPPLYRGKIRHSWPFVNYPMYSRTHGPGERVSQLVIITELDNGTEFEIRPDDLKMQKWFHGIFANCIVRGERKNALEFLKMDPRAADGNCRRLRVVDRGYVFTGAGRAPAPELEVGALEFNPQGERP